MQGLIEIDHNLDLKRFVWLWMKYVTGANDAHHCTNVLRGNYSKKLSKHNANLDPGVSVVCDEQPSGSFAALYVCGVARQGYANKKNYPHNLHIPILPALGRTCDFVFEEWRFGIRNGIVLPIPPEAELPECYRALPSEYTTCRIFRWAVTWFQTGTPGMGEQGDWRLHTAQETLRLRAALVGERKQSSERSNTRVGETAGIDRAGRNKV
jgi:hypothetical protein